MRYLRVGGTKLQPRRLSENAATPTRRVHAVLGRFCERILPRGYFQYVVLYLIIARILKCFGKSCLCLNMGRENVESIDLFYVRTLFNLTKQIRGIY